MKFFLLTFLSICFAVGTVVVAQDLSNQAPQKYLDAGIRLTSIMGTVRADQRAWNVDNPGTLKGHEGHYVRVEAYIYSDKGSIHITEVKMPTANERRQNDKR